MSVTIGLPFFNNRRTLPQTLASIFAQTYTDWELIAIDDGSSDGSLELMRQVRDPRVRVLSDGQHKALSARLNQIARAASGEFLARMDADDVMHSRRIEAQVAKLRAERNLSVVGSATYVIDDASRLLGKRKVQVAVPTPAAVMRARGFLVHPSVCGRTAWFRDNPYSEASWCERAQDFELWMRTIDQIRGRFYHFSQPLLFYRMGAFDYAKYRKSMRVGRRVVARYAVRPLGRIGTLRLLGRFWGQQLAYRAASLMGFAQRLSGRRLLPLTAGEEAEAQQALCLAISQPVPGLDAMSAAG